jgi:hypothetical protein
MVAATGRADTLRSDPAFLGIGMSDYPAPNNAMACQVNSVTRNTGADAAGLSVGDVIVRIDGVMVSSCDELSTIITGHSSGDSVPIELLGSMKRTIVAQLSSRTEVMRRGLVGRPLDVELAIPDGKNLVPLDLSGRGRVTLVGWFEPGCADCASVFSRVAKWTRTGRTNDAYAVTIDRGSTPGPSLGTQFRFDIPVAFTTPSGLDSPIIFDGKRIMFMVIDTHGQVSYIAPVAPGADDLDAALDELFVAADHARADRVPSRRALSSTASSRR